MCEICINRSCSKADILLRRTDKFGPVCFINAFLSPISKAETQKRTLFQTDNFSQFSDKKVTCLTPTRIKLDIFVNFLKENIFLHFKTIIFLISPFSSSTILLSRTLYLFFLSCPLQPTKSCFVSLKVISNSDLQTIHHSSMNY